MNIFIIFICKIIQFFLTMFGKGSSFPGKAAYRINKHILSYFKLPEKAIFVTGTTGKSSVSHMLSEIYRKDGMVVANNEKGSNLIFGVISALIANSRINGQIKADAVVLEIDERSIKYALQYIKPTYLIITNLSRDQLARNGHYDLVFKEINDYIKEETCLVLNGDDPTTMMFSLNKKNKILFFGLKKTSLSLKDTSSVLDTAYCPICNRKLEFKYFHYGNLGNYECNHCDFKRPKIKYEASMIDINNYMIGNDKIKLKNSAIYNIYNILACYTVAVDSKIAVKNVVEHINNMNLDFKRTTNFEYDKINGEILLSKNETPISYNQSIDYVVGNNSKKTIALGFLNVSGRYSKKDLSWLYDIDFEKLNNKSIEKIILVGPFALNLLLRLKYGGIDPSRVIICEDYHEIIDFLIKETKTKIYCLFYFDLEKKFKKEIVSKGGKIW